ncbi:MULTISPECIES: magnesium/cobalt transporter CorA [Flavobacterium]|jgi:magnesium transporter|uniref:Magnesium transport protein CorA n=1 Tax=Flavobacterium cupriresistens TaxID=2893885 RepID=A0ABU4RAU0_9FLAO|nr:MULTISPECIES: magnesium/cobalt transporter CorA [unclassified Flavobacterium]KLT69871.1 magnesium transporter [Flavobacterium sp. ABG]MDX6189689.1 magnesium/cobalt transporter CorA [Flavobacterium sp. Fl-318]UFH40905.1 magnesium/cobalt transporter CorA [Flavobacterium sp. F-323]
MRKIKYKKGRKLQHITLEYTGSHKEHQSEMQLFVYDDADVIEYEKFSILALNTCVDYTKNNWLNIHGLNDINLIKTIGAHFKVDDFLLADILNTTKRTKLQEQQDILFFNIKSILPSEYSDNISVEQISFILKDNVLISFQEKRSDFFTHIRERLRTHSGIVRTKKVDYLLYLLLDAVMENFYITLEDEEDKVEELINETKKEARPIILEKIENHRDNLNFLKRSIIPLRDSLYYLKSIKDDNTDNGIEKETFNFFIRLHQKSLELLEQIESDMSSLESASNFYFSEQSRKMNEIMKTLTIISAIFIPLTFIVGVYGMNFDNMPELRYKYGYHYVMIAMFFLVIGLIVYFKKRRWF